MQELSRHILLLPQLTDQSGISRFWPCPSMLLRHLPIILTLKNTAMKTLTAAEKNEQILNDVIFNFTRATKQEPSITAWEEDNEEYTSWNLILDKQDISSC
jgi:hypothetical protein